jgi:hypothetical protein
MDGWMQSKIMNGWIDRWMDRRIDGWMDEWMNRWIDGWMKSKIVNG